MSIIWYNSSMYILNKIVGVLINPIVPAVLVAIGLAVLAARARGRKYVVAGLVWLAVWLWVWSMPALFMLMNKPIERMYPSRAVADYPQADAIVLLGGGMSAATAKYVYPDLGDAADRVWHAARLYHAGKAPLIVPTGCGENNSAAPYLRDLGVPAKAILVESQARNTEENVSFTAQMLRKRGVKRVLLVTSYWHMPRSMLLFQRTNLEVIPAPTDYCSMYNRDESQPVFKRYLPDAWYYALNNMMWKEYIGILGYRYLRRGTK